MQFCRVDQTVLHVDRSLLGFCGQFRRPLFNRFYYIFTGASTSKADKFDNLRSMKILNTPLTQKNPGIRTKRLEEKQNLQTKKGAISWPWRMRVGLSNQLGWEFFSYKTGGFLWYKHLFNLNFAYDI